VRAYVFDLANFLAFLAGRTLGVEQVRAVDLFNYLDWQREQRSGVAASTMNRRVSTVRSWCEFLVTTEALVEDPVPRPRRSSGLRAPRRGMLGHVGRPNRSGPAGGRLVSEPSRLPESLDPDDVGVFLADLNTHRDRAVVLAMVLGGLRSAEVRTLRSPMSTWACDGCE
jgi:integrase/recombinase XerC